MRDDDLAVELVGVGRRRWRPRRPRRWRGRRARRRRRRALVPGSQARRPGRPSAPAARRRPAAARSASRDPSTTSCPTAASRAAMPRPAGPVPPSTPILIPRASHSPPPTPDIRRRPSMCRSVRSTSRSTHGRGGRGDVSHARGTFRHDRPRLADRTPAARPRDPTRRCSHVLDRDQLGTTASRRRARARPARRVPDRRRAADRGSSSFWRRASPRADGPCVVPLGGGAAGARRLSPRRARDHRAGTQRAPARRRRSCTTAPSTGPRHRRDASGGSRSRRSLGRCATSAAVVRPWTVERAVDEALRREARDAAELSTRVAADARRPRTSPVHGDAGDPRAPRGRATDPGESEPERRIAELLAARRPARARRASTGSGSAAGPSGSTSAIRTPMIAIEYDGWELPLGAVTAFDADRARANELALLGLHRAALHVASRATRTIVDTVARRPRPSMLSVERRTTTPDRHMLGRRSGAGSGDAVGAEEDAELGEEAVAGVDEVVVAEAEHGGLLGALEVHEHRAVAGVLGEDAP